nr:hypothetical protein [uncultured Desulfobulbus sp.]
METATSQDVLKQFEALYHEVFAHDGYGDIRLEMRILRRGQKEVIIHCGKQYRFVVDFANNCTPQRTVRDTSAVLAGKGREGEATAG